ncbi:hypothetical protein D3C85_679520 [compost metagenome]
MVKGGHYVDLRDLDVNQEQIISAMEACRSRGSLPPMIVPDEGVNFFKLPDMTSMDFSFSDSIACEQLRSIHRL